MADSQRVQIEGRELTLSNLDKELYPSGFTKAQVIDYYLRVAPSLLPHLDGRPLTLKRYPNGTDSGFFYEKNCPQHRPDWMATAEVPRKRGSTGMITYCTVGDVPSLVWVANLASLELHPLLAVADDVECPTWLVFDLDPGPPADVIDCARVALWVRDSLGRDGLEAFPKTSGSKGMQLYVPLNTPHTYEDTKPYAHDLARRLTKEHPDAVVERMDKSIRGGKVLIDWSQNHPTKTTVSVYSLRARPTPMVSTPVTWSEVEDALRAGDPARLEFDAPTVLRRVEENGDLFRPVVEARQSLPR